MTIKNQNVKINQGDTVTLFVALTQADGTPFDSTLNAVMKWRLMRNAYDNVLEALVKKDLESGITVVTTPVKGVNIALNVTDTNLPVRFYYHELKIWDSNDVTTAMTGLVIIKRAVQMVKEDIISPAAKMFMLSGTAPKRTP